MALKSATTILATIQHRRGAEENFDPDQMTAGEWAVSTDSKKVWMCFTPGLVLRMATYEAFEEDMKIIQKILEDCQDIKLAVEAFVELAEQHASQAESWSTMSKSWAVGGTGTRDGENTNNSKYYSEQAYKNSKSWAVGGTGTRIGEDTDNAKYYSEQAKASADKAESLTDIGIMTTEKAGIGKPDGTTITVDPDGTMHSAGGGGGESGDFVKKTGDTMTGELITGGGTIVSRKYGKVGNGFVNFAHIEILKSGRHDKIIMFEISGRGRKETTRLYVRFDSYETIDPGLFSFTKEGECNYPIYIKKTSESNWDLYAQKDPNMYGYGSTYIFRFHSYEQEDIVSVTYPGTTVSNVGDDWIEATITGMVHEAENATNDSNGKKISETYAKRSIYGDTSVSLGRKDGSTVGENSIAYGTDATASGIRAVSLGVNNVSSGTNSFSSGAYNESVGNNSASFGNNNVSVDSYSFSEGCGNIALGYGSHVEGAQNISGAKYVLKIASYDTIAKTFTFDDTYTGFSESFEQLAPGVRLHIANVNYINDASVYTVASVGSDGKSVSVNENIPTSNFSVYLATIIKSGGNYRNTHAEGNGSVALNILSHAEGYRTESRGYCSHTEGHSTEATNNQSHAEGYLTTASGVCSHSEGEQTIASGRGSHAGGIHSSARGEHSFAHGFYTTALEESSCAIGYGVSSLNFSEFKCGKHSTGDSTGGTSNNTEGNAFVVGNGTDNTSSNAFSVKYSGVVKAKSTITASTVADYAEFFEWSDGNLEKEDRVGKFVSLEGNKIKTANSGDYILGIVSGAPFVLGNGDCDMWNGAYLRDDFRRIIYEPAPLTEEDKETGKRRVVTDENGDIVFSGTRPKVNPEYDQNKEYISRADRPEWDAVGMVGVLPVRDDGTCKVGKFCKCADGGIATLATERGFDTYMVIERVNENIVSVILK